MNIKNIIEKHKTIFKFLALTCAGRINAFGGYSNEDKIFIYCVVNKFEVPLVKHLVRENDPKEFVTMT